MCSQNCLHDTFTIITESIQGGITAIQYREKGLGALKGDAKITLAKELRHVCQQYRVPFIINDDIELIDLLHVDGVHVGQNDVSVVDLRKAYPNLQIGLSVSNEQELKNSPLHLIDYRSEE